MPELEAGDIVRADGTDQEMMIIGRADDPQWDEDPSPSVFCVWEQSHFLHEEVFELCHLRLVRKERRRIPRNGSLPFPTQ